MKVSIVIPAYNVEKWIGQCLYSIVNQSYKDIEIVVVNDGSKDRTLEVVNFFAKKESRIIIIDQINQGAYLSRKAGIKRSTGEVIFHCDADDFLEHLAIELLVKRRLKTNADIVIGNLYFYIKGRRRIIRNKLPLKQNKIEIMRSLLNNEIKGYLCGKLYDRRLFSEINLPEKQLLPEDLLLNFYIFTHNEDLVLAIEETPIYNYRIHDSSTSSTTDKVLVETVYESIILYEYMLKEDAAFAVLSREFCAFKCRSWLVYSRLGGILAKDKNFRKFFYAQNYQRNVRRQLALYQNVELLLYRFNNRAGQAATKTMKTIQKLIS